jgi:hypothetical protein
MISTSHKDFELAAKQARERLEKEQSPEVMILWDIISQRRYELIKLYLQELGHE